MEKQDKKIVCKDCGQEFTFSVRDQEFYEQMGFQNEPVRCKECRDKKKAERNNNRSDRRPRFDDRRPRFEDRSDRAA